MLLAPHGISLAHQRCNLLIQVAEFRKPKVMHVIAGRGRFNPADTRKLDSPFEPQPAVQPVPPWFRADKPHADLKNDGGLLRVNGHRPARANQRPKPLEQLADHRILADEMVRDPVAAARVPDVARHEAVAAARAGPERFLLWLHKNFLR